MSYEVDVRAVGEKGKSGDAIAIRYGDFSDTARTRVVVIDGGFKDSGEGLVELVRDVYGTDRVDLVISTHPDQDHISGLSVVLEELEVGELWMHKPWDHSKSVANYISKGIAGALSEKQQLSFTAARDLYQLAVEKGVHVQEPFTGLSTADGLIRVLGPDREYYEELFEEMADAAKAAERSVYESVVQTLAKALKWFKETWDKEGLEEPSQNDVSPRNNSSAIILAQLDDTVFLFTADAGVAGLERAVTPFGPQLGGSLKYVQVPHHGSKRNVGPGILDFLLGAALPEDRKGEKTGIVAFISAAKSGAPKHPSPRVTNALNRRGARVQVTAGGDHCYHSLDAPSRGWGPITPLPFVEDYED